PSADDMPFAHPQLERLGVYWLRLPALDAFGYGGLKRAEGRFPVLVPTDEIADVVAGVAVAAAIGLLFNPGLHGVRQGYVHRRHSEPPQRSLSEAQILPKTIAIFAKLVLLQRRRLGLELRPFPRSARGGS